MVGHDVKWIAEVSPSAADDSIVELANQEGRIILSADLDFGELIFRLNMKVPGLLLLRMRELSGTAMML